MADCPKMGQLALRSPESNPPVQLGGATQQTHMWATKASQNTLQELGGLSRYSGPCVAHRVAEMCLFLHTMHGAAGLARAHY